MMFLNRNLIEILEIESVHFYCRNGAKEMIAIISI